MTQLFRSIVIISTALTIVFYGLPYIDYMWYSNEQLYLLDQDGLDATFTSNDYIYWGLLITWVLLAIGLYFFNKFSRACFSVLILITLLSSLLYGVRVLSPYEMLLSAAISMSDGAIFCLLYTSPSPRD